MTFDLSMEFNQGLFKLDFSDHHAVLGLPVTADSRAVRKRYLTIARRLHPDSQATSQDSDAQRASDWLSRWVNPAYEVLSQEKLATEHQLMLKLKGQALGRGSSPPVLVSQVAQTLLQAPQLDMAYRQAVNTLAVTQYDQLDQVADRVAELSELNLVYLYRTSDRDNGSTTVTPVTPSAPGTTAPPPTAATPPPYRQTQTTILASYLKRAQEFERDGDYRRAIVELRELIKTYPNNAQCHGYLASLYLRAGQTTMARIHTKRALEIDPDDTTARTVNSQLTGQGAASRPGPPGAQQGKPGSPGLFGLFGRKQQ
ncbi:MAG: DnaJ domain-containing protein [Nodosilinea sp.]